jgi:hypothetical protein
MWKNYGNGHTIFDASNSTSPQGGGVNNTNSDVAWSATYPTIMGWNGLNTYGVRVDSARRSDSAGSADSATSATSANFATTAGTATNATTATTASNALGVGQSWQSVSRSPDVWYQNTTGRTIAVQFRTTTNQGSIYISTTPSGGPLFDYRNGISDSWSSGFFVVPPNHYYLATGLGIDSWNELR